jgi:TP901-1 family phage major tail protein
MGCGKGVAGYKGKPYVSTDGGSTYLVVANAKDMSISKNMTPIDVTSFDSVDGWKEFIEGLKEWEVSIEVISLEADPGQEAVLGGITEGSELIFQYRPNDVSGAKYFEGTVLVKSWEEKNALEDAVMISGSFQGCGKPQTLILP